MATKSQKTPSKTVKTNTPTGGIFKKGRKFDVRIMVLIGAVLIAAVGFLYVRLSHAGAYLWDAKSITINYNAGIRSSKVGRPAIQSVNQSAGQDSLQVGVNSYVEQADIYCVEGYSSGGFVADLSYRIGTRSVSITDRSSRDVPAGNYTSCGIVPANTGGPRFIEFFASKSTTDVFGSIYVYSMYRKGTQAVVPAAPPATQNPTTIDCSIQTNRRGSTGFCVRIIQESLKNLGYDPGPIDSNYGEKTESAVKIFQQKNSIVVDGIVGPITYKKLGDPNAARKQ